MSTPAFSTVDEILDYAIAGEVEAAAFYTDLAGRMSNPAMKQAFLDFAKEEQGHQAKLVAVKTHKRLLPAQARVIDLKLTDYLVAGEISADMDYGEALIAAMKREKASFKLYSDLAASTEDGELRDTFLVLAQEEAKHKLRFELEYDEHVLKEN